MTPTTLIFKIVARAEWEKVQGVYEGSAHDRADGFLHFSTGPQLAETLAGHYAGQNDLVLVGVDAARLGDKLRWEHAPSRGQDFPHLYAALPVDAVVRTWPLLRGADGTFALPQIREEVS